MQDILNTQKVHALGLKNTEGIRADANTFEMSMVVYTSMC